ncbi:MAG: hypothetical protein V2A69_12800 [Pseudomonadota bacterium]
MGFDPASRSGSEAYFAKDYQMPERLFRMIISRRHPGTPEERGRTKGSHLEL